MIPPRLQPKKVDHVMEILKLEREPVKKVDHLMEILKIEHAAAAASSLEQANGYQFPANDHVMAIMAYSAVPKVRSCAFPPVAASWSSGPSDDFSPSESFNNDLIIVDDHLPVCSPRKWTMLWRS